jgi:hypothetical protein
MWWFMLIISALGRQASLGLYSKTLSQKNNQIKRERERERNRRGRTD